ncbi:MAG: N-6 DNA methylase [Myxococcaceae bacterium]|nr:N-6 DNA methylase [Myxococcaceae bacterium]
MAIPAHIFQAVRGELFKALTETATAASPGPATQRLLDRLRQGEINEHLLGHIFEESLSHEGSRLTARRRHGVYYTSRLLADSLASSALRACLDEAGGSSKEERRAHLARLRVVDLSCGAGAFLASAYHVLLQEYRGAQDTRAEPPRHEARGSDATLLRSCLYGCDLLPRALEIAGLALWLRAAREGGSVAAPGQNLVRANSLEVPALFERMRVAPGSFDLVLGNPPWGSALKEKRRRDTARALGLDASHPWDSWELFVALGLYALRPGGRLALVLPDTFFSPEKAKLRELLLRETTLEKLHNLGPDWFGTRVRMGTLVVQARKAPPARPHDFAALLLHGAMRRAVLRGEVPLPQAEARFTRRVPQERSLDSPRYDIELFRGREDDRVMATMASNSEHLETVCERGRGEEMSKSGLLWRCPGCRAVTPPGEKRKGGGYRAKPCPRCGRSLAESTAHPFYLVEEGAPRAREELPFVDGDDLVGRYTRLRPTRRFKLGVPGWNYKEERLYQGPKLLLRQAGVGVAATCDFTDARFPQSVYFYRVKPGRAEAGLAHEFVLAALLSRAMAFYVFKRFGEVDPARAMAKLTHERLATLPIPKVDLENEEERGAHDAIVAHVRSLLSGASPLGGPDDQAIELQLRSLWRLSPEDGRLINEELQTLPEGQILQQLFPKAV